MKPPQEFLTRPLRRLIIGSSLFLFLFFAWSSAESRKRTSNQIMDWMPQGTPEVRDFLERYYPHFPEGELLMVSWEGCHIEDSLLDDVAEQLLAPPGEGKIPFFERVPTTRSVVEELSGLPDFTVEKAKNRLRGWLIGQNGSDACLVALITRKAQVSRADAVEYVYQTVESKTKLPRSKIYVAGTTIDSVAIDKVSAQSQKTLLPFFLVFCLVLLFACLRQFFAAMIVFFVAITNEELSGTLLYWTGAHVDSISMLIASLVYALTISGGVHLINYYRETLHEADEKNAPFLTLQKAWLPCSLATVTTVLGFSSLAVGKMIPIRTFGIFASLALSIGTVWFFLFLLAVLQQHPIMIWRKKAVENPAGTFQYRLRIFWEQTAAAVKRHHSPIVILTVIVIIVFAWGSLKLKTAVTFHGMLPNSNKVIQDYNRLEEQIGGLIPIEVVLEIPDQNGLQPVLLNQLYLLNAVKQSVSDIDAVGTVISALNFLPALPAQKEHSVSASARRSALTNVLQHSEDRLTESRFFDRSNAASTTYWRLSLRTFASAHTNYAELLHEIRHRIESVRGSETAQEVGFFDFCVTGGVPLAHRAQNQLLHDLINSFLTAFILIAVTMMLMLRGIVRGLIAMVPNVFPCILVFGAMGWFNYPIDIGSMMTASVAMGISIDGTLHFMTWFGLGLKEGLDRRAAVVSAYCRCATALTQTAIICGAGMLVFGFSDFIPVSRFAFLLCMLLFASLIGDIIVLPAMLFGRLGRFFEPKVPV